MLISFLYNTGNGNKALMLLALLFPIFLFGQNTAMDSINRLIPKATSDTARINLLLQKLTLLSDVNLDSAIAFGNQVLQQSKKIGYKKGYGSALTSLTGYYSFTGNFVKARQAMKEGEEVLASIKDDKALGMHYNAGYGIFYGVQSKYDSAAIYFLKAIDMGERNKDSVLLSGAWQNIAIGYYMQSNFSTAISYQQKALDYYEMAHDANGQAKVLMNMGNAYTGAEDTGRAKQAFLKTIAITQKTGNLRTQLYAFKNLATLLDKTGTPDSVYTVAMKAALLARQIGDRSIEASGLSLAAESLARRYRFAEAETLNRQAIALADTAGVPYNIYQVYAGMARIYKLQDKYPLAIEYFEKAFAKLQNSDFYEPDIAGNYMELSRCYENTRAPLKALEAFKIYTAITDSVRKKDNVRKITELSLNYDFNKKQQETRIEQEKRNAAKNAQQVALLAILGAVLLLAVVALVAYRNKQKANTLLNSQKEEIEAALAQLRDTQSQLIQSEKMASLGELTAGIAHEIQNPLNFVNNFSEINSELIEELKAERQKGGAAKSTQLEDELIAGIEQNMEKINHHGKRADAIVKGMLQHSRSSAGQKEPADINALCDEYLRLAYHGLRAKDKSFNATLRTDYDENIGNINIVPQDIGRVILNLITNAFYATSERRKAEGTSYEPTVSISTKKLGGKVLINVADNGGGIPQKIMDKIFQPFFTTKPTGQGTGLGLSLSYDIVKAHGGELKVANQPGKDGLAGAVFTVLLPGS